MYNTFAGEAAANGIDVSEWVLEGITGPSSWRIMGNSGRGQYVPEMLPNSGFLGQSTSQAYDRLQAMYAGMRMVRFTREDSVIRARLDKGNSNG
jgi:hypothetical protein